GKTELACQALANLLPERRQRSLLLRIAPDEPGDQVRLNLAQQLVDVSRDTSADIAALRGDPEELVALAIDLSEQHEFAVLVDDLHHSDAGEMIELVRQVAAYARRSKWIFTTRSFEALAGLPEYTLELGAMQPSPLQELAATLASSADAAAAAVASCAGSPWLLKQFLAAGTRGVELSREGVLTSIEHPRFLRALASLRMPLPLPVLLRATGANDVDVAALLQRGLVYERSGGLVAHDQVRSFLFPPAMRSSEDEIALAEALRAEASPIAQLEALRLLQVHGQGARMVELLQECGEELFAHGHAPTVWSLIAKVDASGLVPWKLRSAVELGNSTVLASVQRAPTLRDEDALPWAATQYLSGQPQEALVTLKGQKDAAALTLAARCHLSLGDLPGAEKVITDVSGLEAEALRLHIATLAGANTTLELGEFVSQLNDAAPECLLDVAAAFFHRGVLERADNLLDRVLRRPRGQRRLLVGRRARLLAARIRFAQGRLSEASDLLDLVRPFTRGMSRLRPELAQLDGELALTRGEFAKLEAPLLAAMDVAEDVDVRVFSLLEATHRRAEALRADRPTAPAKHAWLPNDVAAIDANLARIDASLHDGSSTEGVLEELDSLRAQSAKRQMQTLQAHIDLVRGDALLLHGSDEGCDACAERLLQWSEQLASPRWRMRALLLQGRRDVATLERVAAAHNVAPAAARRATFVLTGSTPDSALSARLRALWSGVSFDLVVEEDGPVWGLDYIHQSVWNQDGSSVPLAKTRLLWRILETMAERGGTATKEALVEHAWGESSYHPLRHDSKVHVAIRKLRKTLGEERGYVLTEEDGYRLTGTVRRLQHT
ncbi:MAG: hypothetical protein AAF938_17800, partial [Myxococcota bacterium]